MVVEIATFVRDILFFIKNDFLSNITDPIESTRSSQSRFVITSYAQRLVIYPMITLKVTNYTATKAGMQTTAQDIIAFIEVRIWARNEKEKEEIATACFNRLNNIQFTANTGSIANYLYDFELRSAIEVDEEGEDQPKSRILNIQYKFFNA